MFPEEVYRDRDASIVIFAKRQRLFFETDLRNTCCTRAFFGRNASGRHYHAVEKFVQKRS